MPRRLLVKATAGADAPERAMQALTVAATGVSLGTPVSLWLTGEAVWFAVAGRAAGFVLDHSGDPADLITTIAGAGQITVCTQCAARRDLTAADLLPGTRIAGAATFLEEALDPDTTTLVY